MAQIVGVKQAHQQFTRLIRSAEDGRQVIITRDGTPVAVLLGARDFNSLMASLEETADPGALRALREAQADSKAGRVYTYEEVFGHPPAHVARKKR